MIIYCGELRIKAGTRSEYIEALRKANLEDVFRRQRGNVFYYISASITDENTIIVTDAWETQEAFDAHVSSEECKVWFRLQDEYFEEDIRGDTFTAETFG